MLKRFIFSSAIALTLSSSAALFADQYCEGGQSESYAYEEVETPENKRCGVCSRCKARKPYHVDYYAERRFQDTGWASRRGEELSDQLSR